MVSCEENVAVPLFPHYESHHQRLSVKLIFNKYNSSFFYFGVYYNMRLFVE